MFITPSVESHQECLLLGGRMSCYVARIRFNHLVFLQENTISFYLHIDKTEINVGVVLSKKVSQRDGSRKGSHSTYRREHLSNATDTQNSILKYTTQISSLKIWRFRAVSQSKLSCIKAWIATLLRKWPAEEMESTAWCPWYSLLCEEHFCLWQMFWSV